MKLENIIKNIGFELKRTQENNSSVTERYYYQNYQFIVEYDIEFDTDNQYSLNKNVSEFEYEDVFIKTSYKEATILMNKEFEHILRKKKIEKILNIKN